MATFGDFHHPAIRMILCIRMIYLHRDVLSAVLDLPVASAVSYRFHVFVRAPLASMRDGRIIRMKIYIRMINDGESVHRGSSG